MDTPEPTQGQAPEPNPTTAATPPTSDTNGTNGPSNGPTNGPAAVATRREAAPPAPSRKYYTITELNEAKPKDMLAIAKEFGVTDITPVTLKPELITRILQAQTEAQGNIFAQGILEIVEDGFGFLRRRSLLPSPDDVYVGSSQVRRLGLRTGDYVTGQTRPPKDNEKYFSLLRVEAVNGVDPEVAKRHRPRRAASTTRSPS